MLGIIKSAEYISQVTSQYVAHMIVFWQQYGFWIGTWWCEGVIHLGLRIEVRI